MVLSHNFVDVQNIFISLPNSNSDTRFVPLTSPYECLTGDGVLTVTNGAYNTHTNLLYIGNGVLHATHTLQDVSRAFMNTQTGYFDASFQTVTHQTWKFGNQSLVVTDGTLDTTHDTLNVEQGVLDICACVIDWSHNIVPITNTFYDLTQVTCDASQQTLTNYAITPYLKVTGTMDRQRNLSHVDSGTLDVSSVSTDVSLNYTQLSNMFIMADTTLPLGPSVPVTNYVVATGNISTLVNSGVVHTALGLVYVSSGVRDISSTTLQQVNTSVTKTFLDVSTGVVDAGSSILSSTPYTIVNGSTTTSVTTGTLKSDQTVLYAASGRSTTSIPRTTVSHTYIPFSNAFINVSTGTADPSCVAITGSWTSGNGAITASVGTLHLGKSICYIKQGIRDQSAVSITTSKVSTPYSNTFLTTSGTSVAVDTGFVSVSSNYVFTSGPGSICTVSSGSLNTTRSLIYVATGQWDISSSTLDVSHTYTPVTSKFYYPLTGILDASTTALDASRSYFSTDASGRTTTTTVVSGFWNGSKSLLYVASGTQDISSSQLTTNHTYTTLSGGFINISGGYIDGSACVMPMSWRDGSNALTVTSGIYSPYNNMVYIGTGTKDVSAAVVNVTHTTAPYTNTFVSSVTGQIDLSNVDISMNMPFVVNASGQIITISAGTVNLKQGVLYVGQGQKDVSSSITTTDTNTPISYTFLRTDTCVTDTTFVAISSTYTIIGYNGIIIRAYSGYISTKRNLIYIGNGQTQSDKKTTAIGNLFVNIVTGYPDATFSYTTPVNLSNGQYIILSGGLYSATNMLVYIGYGLLNGKVTTVQHTYTDISNILINPVSGTNLAPTSIVSSQVFTTTGGLATITSGLSLSSPKLWYVRSGSLDVSNTSITYTKTTTNLSDVIYLTKTQLPSSLTKQTTSVSMSGGRVLTMSGEWYSPDVAFFSSGVIDTSASQLVASHTITPLSNNVWDVCLNKLDASYSTLTNPTTTVTTNGIMTVNTGIRKPSSWYIATSTLDISSSKIVPHHVYTDISNQMFTTSTGKVDTTFVYTTPISLANTQVMNLNYGLWNSQAQLMYVGNGVLDVSRSVSSVVHTYTDVSNIVVDMSYGSIQAAYTALSASTFSSTSGLFNVSGGWINRATNSAYTSSGTLDVSNTLSWVDTSFVDISNLLIACRTSLSVTGQQVSQTVFTVSGGTWLVNDGVKIQDVSGSTVYVRTGVFQSVQQQVMHTTLPLSNVILNQGMVDPSFTAISNGDMYNHERHMVAYTGLRNNNVWFVNQGILDVSSTTQKIVYTQKTLRNVVVDMSGNTVTFQDVSSPFILVNGYQTLTTTMGAYSTARGTVFVSAGQCDTATPIVHEVHTLSAQNQVFWDTTKGCLDTSFLPDDGYEFVYNRMNSGSVGNWFVGDGWASDAKGLVFLRAGTYDISYTVPILVDLSHQMLDVSNLRMSTCVPVDVSYTVDISFGSVVVTRGWEHVDTQILYVEVGAVDVVTIPCSCCTISVTDATNNVILSLPCAAFNAKLGIFKTNATPVTLASGLTIPNYYNPLCQSFIDAQGASFDQIQFGSSELFAALNSSNNIVSIGTFASVYQNFVAYLTSYIQLNKTSQLLNIQQIVSTALSQYQVITPAILWNILRGNGDASGNIMLGSVILNNIKCMLQTACNTNPFGNRGLGGNALDTNHTANYQPWDGFLPGDMISVPQFNLTLNVSVNTIKELINHTATTSTMQTQNVTHTVNCPLIIVLY